MPHPKPSPDEIMQELRRLRDSAAPNRDRLALLHEISVYQEQLEAQNEALVHAQSTLEETRDRFVELYDFAPNGYLTLDDHGVIRQCNLTAAALLGQDRERLQGMPLIGFVHADDRHHYHDLLRRCRSGIGVDADAEVSIRTATGYRQMQLLCRPRFRRDHSAEYLTSLIDVTERKAFEREREQLSREHAALAGRLIFVQDDERARIARNLHDDIGQELTALRLMLELLADEATSASMPERVARVQRALASLDSKLHFVASELRPAALDLGIVAALEQFVRQWSATFGVPVDFHASRAIRNALPSEVETHLYRITQEALNNVSKHADASNVAVMLERHDHECELSIRDDGRGFDQDAARQGNGGLGLVGMRERAQLIGGRLVVESSPRGTSVILRVPAPPSPPSGYESVTPGPLAPVAAKRQEGP